MTVERLNPDSALSSAALPSAAPPVDPAADGGLFGGLVGEFQKAGQALNSAEGAERAFAAGNGGVQEMVFERARADAILEIASAGASKAVQSLNAILNMQV